jgi:uncharacterized protein
MLKFRELPGLYMIVRFAPGAAIPDWAGRGNFIAVTRTADELSIVCPLQNAPEGMKSGPHWICFELEGPFSQTGILLSFIEPLSNNSVPIFAISTYDTDYVLVLEEFGTRALAALKTAGHEHLWHGSPKIVT